MSEESSAASSTAVAGEDVTSRGRLLRWLGAGGAAAAAALWSRNDARAGHDGTNVLHLGEFNNAPAGASTALEATAGIFALRVHNENAGPDAGGILSSSRGQQAAVQGNAFDPSPTGVRGISLSSDGGAGAKQGVLGISGSGIGVEGGAPVGIGVYGHSDTGTGGQFTSESGQALRVGGRAGIDANVDNFAVSVNNLHTGGLGGGVTVSTRGFHPAVQGNVIGQNGLAGVLGFSHTEDPSGGQANGPAIGVFGASGSGSGVEGVSQSGAGVRGHTQPGKTNVAVEAISPDGTALNVLGKSRFSTAGSAVVPAGSDSAFVPNPAVTGESHISVTLVSDPGPRNVAWVDRSPGSGFTVHLSSAKPKEQPETSLTYLVVEPA